MALLWLMLLNRTVRWGLGFEGAKRKLDGLDKILKFSLGSIF
jgi:hypothetical protein